MNVTVQSSTQKSSSRIKRHMTASVLLIRKHAVWPLVCCFLGCRKLAVSFDVFLLQGGRMRRWCASAVLRWGGYQTCSFHSTGRWWGLIHAPLPLIILMPASGLKINWHQRGHHIRMVLLSLYTRYQSDFEYQSSRFMKASQNANLLK